MGAELAELVVGDDPEAWERAGFAVADGAAWIGGVRIRLVGDGGDRGIVSWGLHPIPDGTTSVDGLATHDAGRDARPDRANPNGVVGFDHLVVASPDLDRTAAVFDGIGLELRRVRDVGSADRPRRQMFFWIGEPILELVGPAEATGDGPSRFFGVACTVEDLDATAAGLGEACGRVKDAVQPGRRIATLRHEPLGMSVPIALMSAHV